MNADRLARFRTREFRLGTWLSVGSPVIAELAAESGFDWLLFDLEHGCGSGIMVPHVSTAAEAEACVRAMRYSPHASVDFPAACARMATACARQRRSRCPRRCSARRSKTSKAWKTPAIAEVDGVDALFVGPADLQFDLRPRPALPTHGYAACLQEVAQAAASSERQCAILLREAGELAHYRQLGFTHIAIDSDLGLLRGGDQRIIASASPTI